MRKTQDGVCLCCGKQTKFYNLQRGYSRTCSKSCGARIGQHARYERKDERIKAHIRSKKFYDAHPETKKQISDKLKSRYENQAERDKISKLVKSSQKFLTTMSSDEYRANMHNILIERYSDENARIKMSCAVKNSEKAKLSKTSEEFRQKHSKIMHDRIQRGEVNARYEYDSHKFMSLPELCFYIYLKEHSIRFTYQQDKLSYIVDNKQHYYIPDFKVFNTFVELKGPHLMKNGHLWCPFSKTYSIAKEMCMQQHNVKLFTETQYKKYIDYVKIVHGIDFIKSCRI